MLAVAHYLEALDFQKEIVYHTVFGGKTRILTGWWRSLRHQPDGGRGRRSEYGTPEPCQFHHPKLASSAGTGYLPDVLLIASYYKDWAKNRRRVIEHEPAGLWRVSG